MIHIIAMDHIIATYSSVMLLTIDSNSVNNNNKYNIMQSLILMLFSRGESLFHEGGSKYRSGSLSSGLGMQPLQGWRKHITFGQEK